jgi:hypothetical protein
VLFVHSLYLVTPEGRIWHWSCSYQHEISPARGAFVPITADELLTDHLWLTGSAYITSGGNGEALVYAHGDPPTTTPLEEFLASCAVRLIEESSHQR